MPLHYIIFALIIALVIIGAILTTNFIMKNIKRLHDKFNTSLGILNAELTAMKKKFHIPTLMKGLGFNRKVLCVDVNEIKKNTVLPDRKIITVLMNNIPASSYHLLDRDLVDAKLPSSTAEYFPQLIGYTVIRHNDKILSYSRGKGAEERLHKKRSIGFGGHIDIEDVFSAMQENMPNYLDVLTAGILRELKEELGLKDGTENQWKESIRASIGTRIIQDLSDEVGRVHLAIVSVCEITDLAMVNVDLSEISDPVWLTEAELITQEDSYENWSRIIIQGL